MVAKRPDEQCRAVDDSAGLRARARKCRTG
jgi:hypothetical protein